MKVLIRLSALLSVIIVSACTQERLELSSGLQQINKVEARVSEMPQTKAHLEEGTKIVWDLSDQIGVFSDTDDMVPFSKSGEGNTFKSDTPVKGNDFYAFFPYSDATFDPANRKVLHFSLGNESTAGGKNPVLTVPMIAKYDGSSFSFKQTCGILHFAITGTKQIKSVYLCGNNQETIGGKYTVNLDESIPVLSGNGNQTGIWHFPPSPVQLSESDAYDVYFLLPPMKFENGFTLELEYDQTAIRKRTDKAVTISRAVITNYYVDLDGTIKEEEDAKTLERNALIEFYNATNGPSWNESTNWCSDVPVDQWYGVGRDVSGHVYLIDLVYNGLGGNLRNAILALSPLKKLQRLRLQGNTFNCPIPQEITQMKTLEDLELYDCHLTGTIPEDIGSLTNLEMLELSDNRGLTGPIPASIGNLSKAKWINLRMCNLSGNIPVEITRLHNLEIGPFDCWDNPLLTGTIPAAFKDWEYWNDYWGHIMYGTNLEFGEAVPHCPDFHVTLPDGTVKSAEMLKYNKLTILFQWATWCGYSVQFLPLLKSAYRHFKPEGLEILSWADEGDAESSVLKYVEDNGFRWPNFLVKRIDPDTGMDGNQIISNILPKSDANAFYPMSAFPSINAFDSEGKLVYTNAMGEHNQMTAFIPFMNAWFDSDWTGDDESLYESTDYSRDGTITKLQTASEGNGINVVIMGDAFSDRLLADGTYATQTSRVMEAFFSKEPYKSMRKCFNVYAVDVVSKNEYVTGETALSTNWASGERGANTLSGDHGKVFEYARKAVNEEDMDDTAILVFMNIDVEIGGTCHMFSCPGGDYGRGVSISYFPKTLEDNKLGFIVSHEAGGHGFAKLADEYTLGGGTISEEEVASHRSMEPFGWWRNVDFTDDRTQVKWAQFIIDKRYEAENIGLYQGGLYYDWGVYRPTFTSTMKSDRDADFNAPSRYAIWYRIGKLAYGSGWNGTYEDFVAWDQAHPKSAPAYKARRNYVEKETTPLAPPVIVGHSWKED